MATERTEPIEPCPECGTPCRVEQHKLHKHYTPLATLDIERLANALREDDDHSLGDVDAYRPEAGRIAAEYAALSEPPS